MDLEGRLSRAQRVAGEAPLRDHARIGAAGFGKPEALREHSDRAAVEDTVPGRDEFAGGGEGGRDSRGEAVLTAELELGAPRMAGSVDPPAPGAGLEAATPQERPDGD